MSPLRAAAVVVGALVLQVCLLSQFSYDGARPEIVIAVVLAAGYVHDPDRGAIIGFAGGLGLDVFLSTPFGMTAFVYTVMGYGIGTVTSAVVRSAWWIASLVIGVGSAAAMVASAVVGEVLGQNPLQGRSLVTIVLVVGGVNALLGPVAAKLMHWARSREHHHRRRSVFA